MEMEEIKLYDAIAEMRRLTANGETFSMTHATYNRDKRNTNGFRAVRCARLRPAAKDDDVVNADFKLFYFDEDEKLPRVCWQPLIMFFNGKKIKLS